MMNYYKNIRIQIAEVIFNIDLDLDGHSDLLNRNSPVVAADVLQNAMNL